MDQSGSGSNFMAADGVTATYSRAKGEMASPPTYHITATLTAATAATLNNYIITNAGAELTINKAALTITAANHTKAFGEVVVFDTTTPSADFTVSGLVNGDTVTSVTLTSAGAPADAAVAGSPYLIVPSAAAGSGLTNYIM